ncbi:MAG: hemerythrin family protein [Pseudomonadota bacterium]
MSLDAQYETGVVWQDFQHKQLIDLFEKVKEAKSNHKDKNLYRYTIAFLAMYVNHHFKLEEKYMDKYNYPGKQKHIQEHKDYVNELKIFRSENYDYSEEGVDDLLMRMGEWILSHILGDDKILGDFILTYEKKLAATK